MAAISFGKVPSNRYIRRFPNGETLPLMAETLRLDPESRPGEVKHLSTRRKRKKFCECRDISLVAASETERAQTEFHSRNARKCVTGVMLGVVRRECYVYVREVTKLCVRRIVWKDRP